MQSFIWCEDAHITIYYSWEVGVAFAPNRTGKTGMLQNVHMFSNAAKDYETFSWNGRSQQEMNNN